MKLSVPELEAGLDHIRRSPSDNGELKLIVRRPGVDQREVLTDAELDLELGLIGDDWINRERSLSNGGVVNTDAQITVMNARAIDLLAVERQRWALAGDQLYVDLDLSYENLSPGTVLEIGEAALEVSESPHTGCRAFADRFGEDAARFVNSTEGKKLRLRGVNTKIVRAGVVKVGDHVRVMVEE